MNTEKVTIDVSGMKEHVTIVEAVFDDCTIATIHTERGTIIVRAPRVSGR